MTEAHAYPGHFANLDPDRLATVMTGSGETMTYGELDARANQLSHYLRSLGVEAGDHVAFSMENRIEFLSVAWGCHYAGAFYTAISSRLKADEMAYIVNDCGAKALIISPYLADTATAVISETPNVLERLCVGGDVDGHLSFDDAISSFPIEPLPNRREASDMLYSSGTTGRPKGVKVPPPDAELGSTPGLTALAQALFSFGEGCRYLSPAPLYHAAPLRFNMSVHRVGGTTYVMERFDPEEALADIERFAITTSQWVPTMFVRMLKLDPAVRSRYDVSSLEAAVHAAAPCPIDVKEQMIDWWGPVLHEYYAGTEGNGFTYINSQDWLEHKGSVGTALIGTLRILGDDGNEVPVGDEGGVYFESGSPFEYHNDPDKTAASRDANGWSTLGDVGRVDADGYLYLTDRKAFMIISGGVNIYPQEAENALTMHPKVFDVAVFGVPNEDFGEEVKAVVHVADGFEPSPELERELLAYCRSKLADIKCPRSIDFRDELPRHPTGKLYKRLLKDEYWT